MEIKKNGAIMQFVNLLDSYNFDYIKMVIDLDTNHCFIIMENTDEKFIPIDINILHFVNHDPVEIVRILAMLEDTFSGNCITVYKGKKYSDFFWPFKSFDINDSAWKEKVKNEIMTVANSFEEDPRDPIEWKFLHDAFRYVFNIFMKYVEASYDGKEFFKEEIEDLKWLMDKFNVNKDAV